MNLSNYFNEGISKGVGGFLDKGISRNVGGALLCMALVMCTNACDRAPKEPDPAMVNRALVWGEMRGREVAFFAQEMTMLHPNSQRSQEARRKLLELDDVLRGKSEIDRGEEE